MKWRRMKPNDVYLHSRILAFVRPWTDMYFECGGRLLCLPAAIAFLRSCVLTTIDIYRWLLSILSCCFFYYLAFLCSRILAFWHSRVLTFWHSRASHFCGIISNVIALNTALMILIWYHKADIIKIT